MLLRRFDLHKPETLPALFDLLDRHGEEASVLAGGTELLIALKARVLHYPHLISLKAIAGLADIVDAGDCISIGALATHDAIARHPLVCRYLPGYAALSDNIANIRVRCAGTLGGNLCFAEPHADPPAMLAALGARLRLQSATGSRECAMADFIHGDFETDRQPGEILTAILVPKPVSGHRAAYRCYGASHRPVAGGAAAITMDEAGKCSAAAFWIGAVCGRPVALEQAALGVIGMDSAEIAQALPALIAPEIEALEASDDNHGAGDYKRHLAQTMLLRAAQAANTVAA